MKITKDNIKYAIRNPYAWPGGYPTLFVCADGGTVCHSCARSEFRQVWPAVKKPGTDPQWELVAQEVVYENEEMLYCDHCNNVHESAYTEQVEGVVYV